jgi:hypothetical protein
MVQSSKNENMISENACEVFMNDVMEEEYEINLGLQIEGSQNLENEKKRNEKKHKKIANSKNNVEVT